MNERYTLDGEKTGDTRAQMIKTSVLALVVVCVHVMAIGGFFAIQGCGTVQREPRAVEPAPAPVMPPKVAVSQQQKASSRRAIRPPVPVEPAPAIPDHNFAETYVIQKGDSLSKVAQRYDLSTKELCELNGIKNPNMVRVGQKLILPPYARKQAKAAPAVSHKTAPKPQSKAVVSSGSAAAVAGGGEYVVQSGDMLSKIAVKHGTTVKALREANKLTSDKIVVGQKLVIPKSSSTVSSTTALAAKPVAADAKAVKPADVKDTPAPAASAPASGVKETIMAEEIKVETTAAAPAPAGNPTVTEEAFYYKVMDGDSLEKVAMTFGMTKEEIMRANNLQGDAELKPGQRLLIPFLP